MDQRAGQLAELPTRARKTAQPAHPHSLCCVACLQFDEPQDDFAVALTGLAHGPHAVNDRRLDLDEALPAIALHGPPCRARGQRRGDSVIGCISKGDTNHLAILDPNRAVFSWREAGMVNAEPAALNSGMPSRIGIGAKFEVLSKIPKPAARWRAVRATTRS
jgi:hypothetical protein